jgi:AraC-like DNA-binding protein
MSTRHPSLPKAAPKFWRSDALPHIEAREIFDGRDVCYAPHMHEAFSIGAITGGTSTYVNGKHAERIGAGSVVVMNPGDVHACNPVDAEPWSYRMLYVDAHWLTRVQSGKDWRPYAIASTRDGALFFGLNGLAETLFDESAGAFEKECAALTFFTDMHARLAAGSTASGAAQPSLARVAETIREHCNAPIGIQDLCDVSGLSASHLIRAFKARFGMTPHAYQMNWRIEYCRAQLKRGRALADVAADAGFADQAHMQRTFKRLVAATPGQYLTRRSARSR